MRTKKVEEHVPSTKEPLLVDAGKETSKILVVKLEMAMLRSLAKDRKEMVNITRCEVVWASDGNELENHPG